MPTLADPIAHACRLAGRREAAVCGDQSITYSGLSEHCERLAGWLFGLGLQAGDRVAILSANSMAYLEAYLAIPASGLVIVPLNTRHAEAELRYALQDAGARVLLCDRDPGGLARDVQQVVRIDQEYEPRLSAAPRRDLGVDVKEDDLAGLFYTGGTTGAAKGVMLSHRNLIANAFHYMVLTAPRETDRYFLMAPMFHAAGTVAVLATIWTLGRHVILPAFEPAAALEQMVRHSATVTLGVPTMIAALAELQARQPVAVPHLRQIAHGGSPIATEVVRHAAEAFPDADFIHLYGATETAPLATGLTGEQRLLDHPRARSCGRALVGVQIDVHDEAGRSVTPGEVGEVMMRGPNVMMGYWNKPEQTAAVMRDGWYRSGDLGYLDDEGFLFLVDRAKDMIVSGGENVYSTEVEEVLYQHPAVLEAAVFGVPDAQWGEAVHAMVVLREPATAEQLIEFCRQRIAGYKLPKAISFQDEPLPKSGPGKILKRELRAPFWEGKDRGIN